MLSHDEINTLQGVLCKAQRYRVTAYRGYGNGKMRNQGAAYMTPVQVAQTIATLDKGMDRQMGFGLASLCVEESDNKITVSYKYEPAIALYKSLQQKLILQF